MEKYIPNMYKKTIFDIDFDKLKKNGIKCLIFDLDNTLLLTNKRLPEKKVCYLIKNLKKDFEIFIISNNSSKKRLDAVSRNLDIPYISFALKPLPFGFKKIMKKYNYKSSDICVVGDQIMTDILGGNRLSLFTILVEPLSINELKITSINRYIENKKILKMEKMGLFKKGEYYE